MPERATAILEVCDIEPNDSSATSGVERRLKIGFSHVSSDSIKHGYIMIPQSKTEH